MVSCIYRHKKADTEKEAYYRKLLKDFILIKANSMLRFREMRELKWSMVKIMKRGDKKYMKMDLPKEICKNRKARTVVARNGQYLERVKTYSNFTDKNDYVFPCLDRSEPISKSQYYRYWHKLMKYSGLDQFDKTFSYYSLRHFGITARLYSKVPYYEVAKVAGTNVTNIEKHYEHLDMSKMLDTAAMTHSFDKDGFIYHWVDD